MPLIGNGTGPIGTGTRSGNTTSFATTSGALVNGNCPTFNSGNIIDSGAPCATGSGSGTVSAGTKGQFAFYNAAGTTVTGATLTYAGGMACNGSTDDSVALNAALTAATGGTLVLPFGVCIVTANTILVPSNTTLMGQGPFGTTLKTTSATLDVLHQAAGSTVTSLGFLSTATRTAGVFDTMAVGAASTLTNFFMTGGFEDILVNGLAIISNGTFQDETPNATAAGSGGIFIETPAAVLVSNVLHRMDTSVPASQPFVSMELLNGSVDCTNCDLLQSLHAVNISPGSSEATFLRASASHWDTTFGDTVLVAPRTGGVAAVTNLNGVWIAPDCNMCNGITIQSSGGTIDSVSVVNGTFQAYVSGGGAAINLETTPAVPAQFIGNTIGLPTVFFQYGLFVTAGTSNFQFVGNSTPLCTTNSVIIGTGASNNYMVTNNVRGVTCGAVLDGGSGAFKIVNNNL